MHKDYISIYKELTGIDFDSSKYEVHHIDSDRSNNDIENLVLLPKELHKKYHIHKYDARHIGKPITKILSITENGSGYNSFCLDKFTEFVDVWSECCKWKDYRNFLLGRISNIHNLEIK